MNLERWQELTSQSFAPLTIWAEDPATFEAVLREVIVDQVHLYDMQTSAHRVTREAHLIDESSPSFCKLSLQLRGTCSLEQDGRSCLLEPGDLALYVTQRPYSLTYEEDQASLVVIFPQSMIQMSADQVELITATRISRNSGLGRVAVPLFEQLAQNLEELTGPHAMALVKSALDIVVAVLSAEIRAGDAGGPQQVFHRAASYIDENLDDFDLTPGKVADALFISLRQLHTRFSERELTVAAFIKSRRLQAIRQDLSNPLLAHESVQAISSRYGWNDAAYVSKVFKAEFGESPSAYRKRVLEGV